MMREHELSEFELERDNFKLRIRKNTGGQLAPAFPHAASTHAATGRRAGRARERADCIRVD